MKNKNKLKDNLLKYGIGLLGIITVIILWELYSNYINTPVFPPVKNIFQSLINNLTSNNFSTHFISSIKILLSGVGLAIIVGFTFGLLMAEIKIVNYFVAPIFNSIRGVAGISLYPILIVLFGLSDLPRIIIVFWTAFPSILISTYRQISTTKQELLNVGMVFGASRWRMIKDVKVPLALPEIISGIKIGVGSGWISLVVAEMLGATSGLGYMISYSANVFRFADSYSYLIIVSVLLGILTAIIELINKKVERRLYE